MTVPANDPATRTLAPASGARVDASRTWPDTVGARVDAIWRLAISAAMNTVGSCCDGAPAYLTALDVGGGPECRAREEGGGAERWLDDATCELERR